MAGTPLQRAKPARDAGLSVGLLGIAVVHVTTAVAALRDLTDTFDVQNADWHLPAYAPAAVADTAGWIASGALVLALVLAIGFAVPRIRSGRIAWWIPVVSAVVGWSVVLVICTAAWLADPAVAARVAQGGP